MLVLIDGVPMARPGISNGVDISQIPISLVQRVEYIRGPRSAVYGSESDRRGGEHHHHDRR